MVKYESDFKVHHSGQFMKDENLIKYERALVLLLREIIVEGLTKGSLEARIMDDGNLNHIKELYFHDPVYSLKKIIAENYRWDRSEGTLCCCHF